MVGQIIKDETTETSDLNKAKKKVKKSKSNKEKIIPDDIVRVGTPKSGSLDDSIVTELSYTLFRLDAVQKLMKENFEVIPTAYIKYIQDCWNDASKDTKLVIGLH